MAYQAAGTPLRSLAASNMVVTARLGGQGTALLGVKAVIESFERIHHQTSSWHGGSFRLSSLAVIPATAGAEGR
jgi:hypothetical protein